MFTFPIYVLGESTSFYAMLNAVAMIFNQTGFINSVMLTAGLVVLMSVMVSMLTGMGGDKGKNPPVTAAVFFAGMVALSSVKSTVQVTDVYSGSTVNVSNIPLLISVPSSIFTTGSYKLFQSVETAYGSTNVNYQSVSTSGYVMPLKLLFALRKGVEKSDPYLAASLQQFIIDCIPGSSVNMTAFRDSVDFVEYIFANSRPSGLTNIYSNSSPQGTAMACPDAVTVLQNAIDTYMESAQLRRLINENARERNPTNASGFAISDVESAYTNTVANAFSSTAVTIPGAVQSAGQFMKNALFYSTVMDTFKCMDSAGDQSEYTLCNVILTQGMEHWKTDAAAQGSMFAKMAMPAMIFLQLMFFGFAPLVILYSFFLGAGSVGLYVKFLGFGVWTMSWLPFSAVIQMYIQYNVTDKLAALQTKAVTIGNYEAFMYDVLSTRLALASDLLAATPMVSLALLSGSIYGLSSLAGRWSGRDYMDEKQGAPSLLKTDAAVSVVSGVTGAMLDGKMYSVGMAGMNSGLEISTGQVFSTALSNAKANVDTSTKTAMTEFGKMIQSAVTAGTSTKDLYQFAKSTGLTETEGARKAVSKALEFAKTNNLDATQTEELRRNAELVGSLTAGGSLGLDVGGLINKITGKEPGERGLLDAKFRVGGDVGTRGSEAKGSAVSDKVTEGLRYVAGQGLNFSSDQGIMRTVATNEQTGHAVEKLQSSTFGENNTKSWKEATQHAQQAQRSFQEMDSRTGTFQTASKINSEQWTNAILNDRNDVVSKSRAAAEAIRSVIGERGYENLQRSAERAVASNTYEAPLQGKAREAAVDFNVIAMASQHYPHAMGQKEVVSAIEAAMPGSLAQPHTKPLKGPDMSLEARTTEVAREASIKAADGGARADKAVPIVSKVDVQNPHSGVPKPSENGPTSRAALQQGIVGLRSEFETSQGKFKQEYKAAVTDFRNENPVIDTGGTSAAEMRQEHDAKLKAKTPDGGNSQSTDDRPIMARPMGSDSQQKTTIDNVLAADSSQFSTPVTGAALPKGAESQAPSSMPTGTAATGGQSQSDTGRLEGGLPNNQGSRSLPEAASPNPLVGAQRPLGPEPSGGVPDNRAAPIQSAITETTPAPPLVNSGKPTVIGQPANSQGSSHGGSGPPVDAGTPSGREYSVRSPGREQ
jgi:hypothetical protein